MELGNILFGNSRGEYPVERSAGFEDELSVLFRRIDPEYHYAPEFENEVFAVRPYYWGDCTCGYEAKESVWCKANQHSKDCYQTAYQALEDDLEAKGYNEWGKDLKRYQRERKALCERFGITWNYGLGCAVHCTCDYRANWEKFASENDHSHDCLLVMPNFHYKPTDYQLKWYKYPLRDSYANQELTVRQFAAMIDACIASIK
jgi:hypothetical protein